jgi:hypothetical protein
MADETEDAFPAPPNFEKLYEEQAAILTAAVENARTCFDDIRQQDAIYEKLSNAYTAEIEQVFTIAKVVQNPTMAIASVPVVLALANKTFAETSKAQSELSLLFEKAVAAIDLP